MAQKEELKSKSYPVFRGLFEGEFVAGFSGRSGGNMSLSYGQTGHSLENRRKFLGSLDVDHRSLVCAKQVHTANIRRVRADHAGSGALDHDTALADTDAIITDLERLPIAIFTADCLSIFLYDPRTPAIGLVHAGWRSSFERIAEKTVKAMKKEFNTRPEELCAAFGPAIRSCCYKVGKEFESDFPQSIVRRGDQIFLDLAGENRRQLADCGVKLINILDCGVCTSCHNSEYFSFRKEGPESGRMMSVMMLA